MDKFYRVQHSQNVYKVTNYSTNFGQESKYEWVVIAQSEEQVKGLVNNRSSWGEKDTIELLNENVECIVAETTDYDDIMDNKPILINSI